MFPIHDGGGRVIGFGGRVLDKGEPKYLNSPETPLFEKGRELYGLFQARQAIRDAGRVVVVEGYMDVVALAQHGVEYAVATLGTATTPVHVQKLFRLTDTVVFCFDGDAAGRRAAWRALENTLRGARRRQERALPVPARRRGSGRLRAQARQGGVRGAGRRGDAAVGLPAGGAGQRHPPRPPKAAPRWSTRPSRCWREITAPVLATLLRRGLAELAGLRESEMDALLPVARAARDRRPRARGRSARRRRCCAAFCSACCSSPI